MNSDINCSVTRTNDEVGALIAWNELQESVIELTLFEFLRFYKDKITLCLLRNIDGWHFKESSGQISIRVDKSLNIEKIRIVLGEDDPTADYFFDDDEYKETNEIVEASVNAVFYRVMKDIEKDKALIKEHQKFIKSSKRQLSILFQEIAVDLIKQNLERMNG